MRRVRLSARRAAGRATPPALLLAAALAVALAVTGCRTLGWILNRPPVLEACGGALPSAEAAPDGLRRRAQARVRGGDVDESFTVVLEEREGALALLAITRFGGKAFALRQRGTDVEIVSPRSPGFPVPPESLLRDLHAADLLADGEPATVRRAGCGYEARFVPVVESGEEAGNSGAAGGSTATEEAARP